MNDSLNSTKKALYWNLRSFGAQAGTLSLHQVHLHLSDGLGLQRSRMHVFGTLNSLGTMSFGVFTPTKASTPQKTRMVKMMAKSLMSFRTCKQEVIQPDFLCVTIEFIQKKEVSQGGKLQEPPVTLPRGKLTVVGKNRLVLNCFRAMEQA